MNTIKNNIWGMIDIQRDLGIEVVEGISSNLIKSLEDKAYEQGQVHLLVNVSDMDEDIVNIGDLNWSEDDYSVLSMEGSISLNGENKYFNSEDEYNDYVKENEIEDAPDWYDFAEYSELCWNTFFNYYGEVNIDVANKIGLPIIELRNGDKYISISGCGMDFSFQIMRYQALAHGSIQEKFATRSKLEWAKMNMTTEEYKEMLEALGVSIDRLNDEHYNK